MQMLNYSKRLSMRREIQNPLIFQPNPVSFCRAIIFSRISLMTHFIEFANDTQFLGPQFLGPQFSGSPIQGPSSDPQMGPPSPQTGSNLGVPNVFFGHATKLCF
jgi:hypothetical protein